MAEVICIGIAGVDVLIRGADLSSDFGGETKLAESVEMEIGGDAANEAITLAHLGVEVELMSGVADDGAGSFIRERIRQAGISSDKLIPLPPEVPSALNVILVRPDGERNFINAGAPADGWEPDLTRLADARIVSLASFGLPPFTDSRACLWAAREAKSQGKIVCADMVHTQDCTLDMIRPALAYVDYFFPNEDEAKAMTGRESLDEIADAFLQCGVGHVIVKIGRRGCFVKSAQLRAIVPAYECSNVVDTTGAGDNFLAGFISELLRGNSVSGCCRFACGVAAVSIQKQGATTGVQSREQVEQAIQLMK